MGAPFDNQPMLKRGQVLGGGGSYFRHCRFCGCIFEATWPAPNHTRLTVQKVSPICPSSVLGRDFSKSKRRGFVASQGRNRKEEKSENCRLEARCREARCHETSLCEALLRKATKSNRSSEEEEDSK
jgi:hypothetical protein